MKDIELPNKNFSIKKPSLGHSNCRKVMYFSNLKKLWMFHIITNLIVGSMCLVSMHQPSAAGRQRVKTQLEWWSSRVWQYSCERVNLFFEVDRDLKSFDLHCLKDGSFEEPTNWLSCVSSKLRFINDLSTLNILCLFKITLKSMFLHSKFII